jgi:cephalosporin hydroxylase
MPPKAGEATAKGAVHRLQQELYFARAVLYKRLYVGPRTERRIVENFHRLYYDSIPRNTTWQETFWMGTRILKCPLDLWVYQEIFHELRPDLVVETGTAHGGSAAYMASLFDLLGHGEVVTIDVEDKPGRPEHPRITYLKGSSVAPAIVKEVEQRAARRPRVVVILDSDHRKPHVLAEMRAYARLVPVGSYMIVEDTNVNGHPVAADFGPGPMEAVEEFLRERDDFVADAAREKFLLTFNPRGYLRRVR